MQVKVPVFCSMQMDPWTSLVYPKVGQIILSVTISTDVDTDFSNDDTVSSAYYNVSREHLHTCCQVVC